MISRRDVLAMSPGLAMSLSLVGAARRLALPSVVVTNGDAVVGEAVIAVALPAGVVGESFILRAEDGETIATEVLRERALAFVVRAMAPRETRRFRLEPALDRVMAPTVVAREIADRVELSIDGRPVATYRTQPTPSIAEAVPRGLGRGGYLHPLLTPEGRVVTDDEAPERPEQRGLWSAWGAASFDGRRPDFWHTGAGGGTMEFEGIQRTWSGTIVAGFQARHRAVDRTARPPITAETDTWRVTLPAVGRSARRYRALDLECRHEATTSKPLVVAAAAYGGLGLRGPRAWHGTTGMAVVTADGRARQSASRTRPRWIAVVGLVGGVNAGVAILDHPDNPRHPQPVYVDATQPFVSVAPMQLGPITIAPGRDVVFRSRVVTFDGFPDRAWLEGLWQAYARPPRAVIDWTP